MVHFHLSIFVFQCKYSFESWSDECLCIFCNKYKASLTRKTDRQKSKDRLEVRKAAAVADVVIPALTKQQMVDATSKALFLFNEKLLQVRKLNEGKVIVVSIAVTAEGLHPSRRNAGHSIMREMQQASLWNHAGMANLVRLVPYKGLSGLNHARQQICLVNNARQQIRSSKLRYWGCPSLSQRCWCPDLLSWHWQPCSPIASVFFALGDWCPRRWRCSAVSWQWTLELELDEL